MKEQLHTDCVPLYSTFLDFMFRFSFAGAYEKQEVCGVNSSFDVGPCEVAIDNTGEAAGATRRLYRGAEWQPDGDYKRGRTKLEK